MQTLLALPTPALIALGVIAVVQLTLQIWGLIDLSRRAAVPGGRKWVWAVIIVAGSLLGAGIYLAVGRSAMGAPATDHDLAADRREGRQRSLDRLYGDRDA